MKLLKELAMARGIVPIELASSTAPSLSTADAARLIETVCKQLS